MTAYELLKSKINSPEYLDEVHFDGNTQTILEAMHEYAAPFIKALQDISQMQDAAGFEFRQLAKDTLYENCQP